MKPFKISYNKVLKNWKQYVLIGTPGNLKIFNLYLYVSFSIMALHPWVRTGLS